MGVSRSGARQGWAVVALVALAMPTLALPPVEALGEQARADIGAGILSAWAWANSGIPASEMRGRVEASGLEVVVYAAPLSTNQNGAAATRAWLDAAGPRPHIVQLDTFKVTGGQPDDAARERKVRELFENYSFLEGKANIRAVVGGNEPMSKAQHGWTNPRQAEDRVRMEYRVWREVHGADALPFCHKLMDTHWSAGMSWAQVEGLWRDAQDAVCYDWYEGKNNTLARLDELRTQGLAKGKPVHVLESAVKYNDPVRLMDYAQRIHTGLGDSFVLFTLLDHNTTGQWQGFAAWLYQDGQWLERAPARMLATVPDVKAPITRALAPAEAKVEDTFNVTWDAFDEKSGVACVDVEARDGAGPWRALLGCTSAARAAVTGTPGHTYHFRARALDRAGHREAMAPTAQASTYVNMPPTADPGPDVALPLAEAITGGVRLDARGSADADGLVVDYCWTWDDRPEVVECGEEPFEGRHFSRVGTYAVTLRVTDDDGRSAEDRLEVRVSLV